MIDPDCDIQYIAANISCSGLKAATIFKSVQTVFSATDGLAHDHCNKVKCSVLLNICLKTESLMKCGSVRLLPVLQLATFH